MSFSSSQDHAALQKAWELTEYEKQRTPHEPITDNTEIAISPRSLHSEFMCPICLDLLKKTMTTKVCLHRFCSDCIITALRSGKKECPTCRTKLISKRSLRADPNFDLLISSLYPSREEYEALQQKEMQKLNSSHSQLALVNSITEGIKSQSLNRPNRKAKPENVPETSGYVEPDSTVPGPEEPETVSPPVQNETTIPLAVLPINASAPGSLRMEVPSVSSENPSSPMSTASSDSLASDEIEIIFKPHPTKMIGSKLMQNPKEGTRYVKTRDFASVDHLSEYLKMRMSLDNMNSNSQLNTDLSDSTRQMSFSLYMTLKPGNICSLSSKLTLREIQDKYWKLDKPLELFYSME